MDNTRIPLVSICSLTYNHAPYIKKCLDGFLMQKCSFEFEIIINDDCSTDGTIEILQEYEKKYPGMIYVIYHQENQYSKGGRGFFRKYCYPKAKGKYIAFCEGDDCWTDPLKLQKQVDFLEQHPEYSLSHTDIDHEFVNENRTIRQLHNYMRNYNQLNRNYSRQEMLELILSGKYTVQTLSVCARKDAILQIYEECPELTSPRFKMGDTPLWIELSQKGKFHYLKESTATYHIISESATHSKNFSNVIGFYESCFFMIDFFRDKYQLSKKYADSVKQTYIYFLLKDIYLNRCEYQQEIESKIIKCLNLNIKNSILSKTMSYPMVIKKLILQSIKAQDRLCKRWEFYKMKRLG